MTTFSFDQSDANISYTDRYFVTSLPTQLYSVCVTVIYLDLTAFVALPR